MPLSPNRACNCLPDSDRDRDLLRREDKIPSSTEAMEGGGVVDCRGEGIWMYDGMATKDISE